VCIHTVLLFIKQLHRPEVFLNPKSHHYIQTSATGPALIQINPVLTKTLFLVSFIVMVRLQVADGKDGFQIWTVASVDNS
jgi:hypothetical protein